MRCGDIDIMAKTRFDHNLSNRDKRSQDIAEHLMKPHIHSPNYRCHSSTLLSEEDRVEVDSGEIDLGRVVVTDLKESVVVTEAIA